MTVFQNVKANITENPLLYEPQIQAYRAALSHYKEFTDFKHRESLIVMPTGTGKTGVMSLLPFGISNGRVLVITPGKIVRKTVFKEFDTVQNPEQSFLIKRKIIYDNGSLPLSYLYHGFNPNIEGERELTISKLQKADIVITNVHKLVSSNDEVNLINLVNHDHFDMIIIDEAHHVAADMWQEALGFFKATKVIKLTATPFRGDKLEISTHSYDPIFDYTLGEAIEDGLVKNVVKQEDIPGKITFIDQETNETYSLEKAKEKLGNGFVSKSIAMSEECSKQVINKTKDILQIKRQSYPKHQVLAVTCNDEHAQNVCAWFNELGFKATYVSTRSLSDKEIERRLSDYSNGLYDVMVSIQMLGEGYNNPNISIIALFRPFKTLGPYAQAIGRGLRKIANPNTSDIDNYCNVIYHQELDLEELWSYYKDQETYGKILKRQQEILFEQLSFDFDELGYVEKKSSPRKKDKDIEEDLSKVSVTNTLNVSSYSSKGLGKSDSFTSGGIQSYEASLNELIKKQENDLTEYENNLQDRVKQGIIDQFEADHLLVLRKQRVQNTVNTGYSEFEDAIISESLREDFTRWINTKLEEFFKVSLLEKGGHELYNNDKFISEKHIDNIGYISKNIRQSLYEDTKKNISLYNHLDFAVAKEKVNNKLDYWKLQYGTNKEENL